MWRNAVQQVAVEVRPYFETDEHHQIWRSAVELLAVEVKPGFEADDHNQIRRNAVELLALEVKPRFEADAHMIKSEEMRWRQLNDINSTKYLWYGFLSLHPTSKYNFLTVFHALSFELLIKVWKTCDVNIKQFDSLIFLYGGEWIDIVA